MKILIDEYKILVMLTIRGFQDYINMEKKSPILVKCLGWKK